MINTLIIAGLIFALLCLAAWYGERQARARRLRRMMEAMNRISYDELLIPTLLPPGIFQTGTLRPSYYLGFSRRDITLVSTKTDDGIGLTATMRIPRMNFEPVGWRYTYPTIKDEVNDGHI